VAQKLYRRACPRGGGLEASWIFNLVSGPAMDIQAANMLYGNGTPDIVGPFPLIKLA
jgi:hypothetical protein